MSNNGLHSLYINTISNLGFSDDLNNQLYLSTEGTNSMNSSLDMANNKLINLANPVNSQDGVNKQFLDLQLLSYVLSNNPVLFANLNMNNLRITSVASPVNLSDATNVFYVQTQNNLKMSLTGGTMTGNIDMGANKVTNLGNPTNGTDAINKNYVINNFLELTGGVMSGNIDMGTKTVLLTNLPLSDFQASNKKYVDQQDILKLSLTGGTMTGDLNMGFNKITNLSNPTNSNDGVNKIYIDNNFLPLTGGIMLDNLNMGLKKITNLANPINSNDGVNKAYIDINFLPLTGGTISSNLLLQNYVTIGNTAVNSYPLEITSTAPNLSTAFTSGYTMTSAGVSAISPTLNSTVSLKTFGSIWSQARLIVSSDRRIKYDIEKIDYNTSNEIIKQIQPYKYKMIETNRDEYGYIAQEIKPIIPECIDIHTCKLHNGITVDDYLTIDYKQINIHLMNTVKDLLQRIEKLEKIII